MLNHVNIVKLYAMIFEHGHYGVVLEFVPQGCLEEYIFKHKVLISQIKYLCVIFVYIYISAVFLSSINVTVLVFMLRLWSVILSTHL